MVASVLALLIAAATRAELQHSDGDVSRTSCASRRPQWQFVAGDGRDRRRRVLYEASRRRSRAGESPGIPIDDPHQELAQLLRVSIGRNLGFQLLPNAQSFRPGDEPRVDHELASTIVWLDGLVQNPDRTVKNPNLLWSHNQLWLLDHGAALGFQHDWPAVTEASPRSGRWSVTGHVLRSRATRVAAMDGSLAARIHREALESALEGVPDDFLVEDGGEALRRRRAAYVAFLWKRLTSPRPFVSGGAG